MEIPFFILLILYCIGLFIFAVWSFFNVWHLIKFGFFDFTGKLNVFVFLGFCAIVIFITILLLQDTPWLDTFSFGVFSPIGSSSSGI